MPPLHFPKISPSSLGFLSPHLSLKESFKEPPFLFIALQGFGSGKEKMMNRYAYQHQQQNTLVGFGCVGELRRGENFNSFSMANSNGVVCPKPRRIANVNDPVYVRPSRFHHFNSNQQMEGCDTRARTELLDMVLSKDDYGAEKPNFQVAFSPPFFSGSPPTRASNPVIQDEQFGNRKPSPLSPSFEHLGSPSSLKGINIGGGCVRVKNGHNPAPVRIEGFNCRGNCRVSAVA